MLNWLQTKRAFSSGAVEGLNNTSKVTLQEPTGFDVTRLWNLLHIIHLEPFLNPSVAIGFAGESHFFALL